MESPVNVYAYLIDPHKCQVSFLLRFQQDAESDYAVKEREFSLLSAGVLRIPFEDAKVDLHTRFALVFDRWAEEDAPTRAFFKVDSCSCIFQSATVLVTTTLTQEDVEKLVEFITPKELFDTLRESEGGGDEKCL